MKSGYLIPLGMIGEDKERPKMSYSAKPNLKIRKVWSEGYAVTGNSSGAIYMGECFAESHIEACERIVEGIDRNSDGTVRLRKDDNPSCWGCGLFDNEEDARKSFG